MLLLCVTFALFTVGFVMPCVIDIATTPQHLFDLPSKRTWLVVVVAFWVFGAAVWLLVGRREVRMRRHWADMTDSWTRSDGYQVRHPARRTPGGDYPFGNPRRARQAAAAPTAFIAPDDNPEFLLELERRIQGWRESS